MGKDKQIQKIPKYSIDNISVKSDLATRGLRELGLLKDEKHFTIIYVCQFCGRLINYSSTPCIFCGDYPKTRREVLIAQALSSNSLEMAHLLAVSKAVKNKEDLEIVIANLRQLAEDVLENEDQYPIYRMLFRLMEDLIGNKDYQVLKGNEFKKHSQIACKRCGYKIYIALEPCLRCKNETLSKNEKWIVALNSFLQFVEDHLTWGENEKPLEELIFISVYIINRLIEKDELPEKDLKNIWKSNLREAYAFGGEGVKGGIQIDDGKISVFVESDKKQTDKENLITNLLCLNVIYLLKS